MASLMIAVALVPILYALTLMATTLNDAMVNTVATNVLRDYAETVKTQGYANVPGPSLNPSGDPETTYVDSYPGFQIVRRVSWVPGLNDGAETSPQSLAKRVSLEIYRLPGEPDSRALGRWEFILYETGM